MLKKERLKYLTLKLTNNCNLMCKMCGQVYSDCRNNQELDFKIVEDCIMNIKDLEHIYLFGGEPLLYSRFDDALELTAKKKIPALIATNGILLEKYAEKIVLCGIRDVSISIDSFDEKTYELIRKNGKLSNIILGIEILEHMKRKYMTQFPRISVSSVILPENYLQIEEHYNFLSNLDIEFYKVIYEFPMRTTVNIGEKTNELYKEIFECECNSWRWFFDKVPEFTDKERTIIYKQINKLRKHKNVHIQTIGEEPDDESLLKNIKCNYPFSSISVLPNGNTTFCIDFPDINLGNLHEMTLNDIWDGQKSIKFRSYIENNGCFPLCSSCVHYNESLN